MLDIHRADFHTGATSCTGPNLIFSQVTSEQSFLFIRKPPGNIFTLGLTFGDNRTFIIKTITDILNHLLRGQRFIRKISGTIILTTTTTNTGVTVHELLPGKLVHMGHPESLGVFNIEQADHPFWFGRTVVIIEGSGKNMKEFRIRQGSDKQENGVKMETPDPGYSLSTDFGTEWSQSKSDQ